MANKENMIISGLSIHISLDNAKLGQQIPSVNFPPIVYCNPDAPCAKKGCYACKGHFMLPNVKNGMKENMELWEKEPDRFFKLIDNALSLVAYKFFRWFSSGDIPNEDFLNRMCKLARKHKETKFLCFTKKYDLVDTYVYRNHKIPKNLTIVYSVWDTFTPVNPYNFPTAHVRFKEMEGKIPEDAHKCPKYCGNCVLGKQNCWMLKHRESVVFNKH